MGLFDSYCVPWRKKRLEIQTKQLDPQMAVFELSDTVPHLPSYESKPCFIVEDFSLDGYRSGAPTYFAVLCHVKGQFVDVCFCDEDSISAVEHRMSKNWQIPLRSIQLQHKLNRFLNLQKHDLRKTLSLIEQLQYQYGRHLEKQQNPNGKPLFPSFDVNHFDFDNNQPMDLLKGIVDKHREHHPSLSPNDSLQVLYTQDDLFGQPPFEPQTQSLPWNGFTNTHSALQSYCESFDIDSCTQLLDLYPELLQDPSNQFLVAQMLQDALCSIWMTPKAAQLIAKLSEHHDFVLHLHPKNALSYSTLLTMMLQGVADDVLLELIARTVPNLPVPQLNDLVRLFTVRSFEPLYDTFLQSIPSSVYQDVQWIDQFYLSFIKAHSFFALQQKHTPPYPFDSNHQKAIDYLLENPSNHIVLSTLNKPQQLSQQEEFLLFLVKTHTPLIAKVRAQLRNPTEVFLQHLSVIEQQHIEQHTPVTTRMLRPPPPRI